MPEPYSPLRYPGGKAKLADFLISVINHNELSEPHYVEPYAGGAGAALRLLFEEHVSSITINDADPRINSFWLAVTKHNAAFIELLLDAKVELREWKRQREIYEKRDLRKILELGFATFFLNRTARSGIIHNGGPIGGHGQKGKYKINARFNKINLARRIQRIGMYSDRIHISSDDGLSLLKKLNQCHAKSKQTFVYLDPPYYAKGPELYLNRFNHRQHQLLASYLSSPKNFPWIMTYDDVDAIRKLYTLFPQFNFNLQYSVTTARKGTELLIHPSSVLIPEESKNWLPAIA